MSDGAPSRRRARPPVILLSLLLVLFAAGAIAIAQLYWTSLRTGIDRMQTSVATARREQERLMARVRAAEAELVRRADVAADPGAAAGRSASDAAQNSAQNARDAPAETGLRAVPAWRELTPPERAELAARLDALARDAARLPVGPRLPTPAGPAPAAAKRLLTDQLAVARAAAGAGDVALLDAALYAASRLAAPPYRAPTGRDADLPATLRRLRSGLRVELAVPAAGGRGPVIVPAPAAPPPR